MPGLREIAASIRTAQSIAHHRLAELGDHTHAGVAPRECTRPLCARMLADALELESIVSRTLGDPGGARRHV